MTLATVLASSAVALNVDPTVLIPPFVGAEHVVLVVALALVAITAFFLFVAFAPLFSGRWATELGLGSAESTRDDDGRIGS